MRLGRAWLWTHHRISHETSADGSSLCLGYRSGCIKRYLTASKRIGTVRTNTHTSRLPYQLHPNLGRQIWLVWLPLWSTQMHHTAFEAIGKISTPEEEGWPDYTKVIVNHKNLPESRKGSFKYVQLTLTYRFLPAVRQNGGTTRVIPNNWLAKYISIIETYYSTFDEIKWFVHFHGSCSTLVHVMAFMCPFY